MDVRSILFVTANYPSPAQPNEGTFVRQLVEAIAESGVECQVIHPWKLNHWWRERDQAPVRDGVDQRGICVHRPLCLSLSNRRLGPLNSYAATRRFFGQAVWRAARRLARRPEATYGHFLYAAGATAIEVGRRLGIPRFVAVGEGTFWTLRCVGTARARRDYRNVSGVIAVSGLLQRRLVKDLLIPAHKIEVFPNGVDARRFYPRDRLAMRRKHGLPLDRFLVIYVGTFIESKGVRRVDQAIDGLTGAGGIFLGSGPCVPESANVVFRGKVSHDQVPELLSAADCFALPSDIEGSCNSILEAMACGVPCVVSDGEFNDELAGADCALRMPYADVPALRQAILRIRHEDPLGRELASRGLAQARNFGIQERAQRILAFINQRAGCEAASASTLNRPIYDPAVSEKAE